MHQRRNIHLSPVRVFPLSQETSTPAPKKWRCKYCFAPSFPVARPFEFVLIVEKIPSAATCVRGTRRTVCQRRQCLMVAQHRPVRILDNRGEGETIMSRETVPAMPPPRVAPLTGQIFICFFLLLLQGCPRQEVRASRFRPLPDILFAISSFRYFLVIDKMIRGLDIRFNY